MSHTWVRGEYVASDDPTRLQLDVIFDFLSNRSYWAKERDRESVERSIRYSTFCIGVYDGTGRQVGFARVITDTVVFGWVCDVFVIEEHRGRGLGKWIVELIVNHPLVRHVKRLALRTADAHGLYEKFGFVRIEAPDGLWMERVRREQAPTDSERRDSPEGIGGTWETRGTGMDREY